MGARFGNSVAEGDPSLVILYAPSSRLIDVAGALGVFERANDLLRLNNSKLYSLSVVTVAGGEQLLRSGDTPISWVTIEELCRPIDTVMVASLGVSLEAVEAKDFVQWLRRNAIHARRIGAISTGVLLLAEAGLLNGRQATTDWAWCGELARQYPEVQVWPHATLVHDANIWTSSGFTASVQQALAFLEEDYGYDLMQKVALDLEVPLRPLPLKAVGRPPRRRTAVNDQIRNLQIWISTHLQEPLRVEQLAARAGMSRRTFAREFIRNVGVNPAKYVEEMRVEAAQRLLSQTVVGLESIARQCGFGSADSMRRTFLRVLHSTPSNCRKHFEDVRRTSDPQRTVVDLPNRFPPTVLKKKNLCNESTSQT